jgi:hypothetical protein
MRLALTAEAGVVTLYIYQEEMARFLCKVLCEGIVEKKDLWLSNFKGLSNLVAARS